MKNLSEKERAFVAAFMGAARGNGTKAALLAGYSKNGNAAGVIAWRLLRKVNVQRAIVARQTRATAKAIADAEERDGALSEILRDKENDAFARIGAAKELNKVDGRHSLTIKHSGKLTLEQLLDDSHGKP